MGTLDNAEAYATMLSDMCEGTVDWLETVEASEVPEGTEFEFYYGMAVADLNAAAHHMQNVARWARAMAAMQRGTIEQPEPLVAKAVYCIALDAETAEAVAAAGNDGMENAAASVENRDYDTGERLVLHVE